jgi:hypothetical protein
MELFMMVDAVIKHLLNALKTPTTKWKAKRRCWYGHGCVRNRLSA